MCGIIGLITSKNKSFDVSRWNEAQHVQSHRGPDGNDSKNYLLGAWDIYFAHQRLAIIDLSTRGNQPMISGDKSASIIFNGELYNYIELRRELSKAGINFVTATDTEVMLESLRYWGLLESTNRFNGMWAFAYLDFTNKHLYLSRDRTGEKPLYYVQIENTLYFASELKTLLTLVKRRFSLNLRSVGQYLFQSLVDSSTETFFDGIFQVPAGNLLKIDLTMPKLFINQIPFWKSPILTEKHMHEIQFKNNQEVLKKLFIDSVKMRMRSDVPVGVLLSGGLDSSSIAAVAHELKNKKDELLLLSAVSSDKRFDESNFIDIVSQHIHRPVLKVNLEINNENIIPLLNTVNWHNDAPVTSLSNIAHFLLMKQARSAGIRVILSGQGADELLCGYRKYLGFHIQFLFRQKRYFEAIKIFSSFFKNKTILNQFTFAESKRYLPDIFSRIDIDIKGPLLKEYQPVDLGVTGTTTLQERQLLDLLRYSVPALNHTEDRMSMAHSEEIRLPFLDVKLIEFLISLAPSYKLHNGWTKYIFRKAMEGYLPPEIIWRKDKQGFVNPQSIWLKSSLRETVLEYFSEDALIFQSGLIDRASLLKKYEVFCKENSTMRSRVWFRDIFNPLSLEIWLRKFQPFINL